MPSSLQPRANTNLPSISIDLPILDTSYKWNHTVCGFLCLTSFTEHNIFKFIYTVAFISASFLSMAEKYTTVWTDHILKIHASLMDTWVVSTFWLL